MSDRQKCIEHREISGLLSEDQWRNQATLVWHRLVNVTTWIQRNPAASHGWQSEAVRFYLHSEQPSRPCFQMCWKLASWAKKILLPREYWLRIPETRFTIEILSTEDDGAWFRPSQHFSRPSSRCKLLMSFVRPSIVHVWVPHLSPLPWRLFCSSLDTQQLWVCSPLHLPYAPPCSRGHGPRDRWI